MKYVYILQSIPFPERFYIGNTTDLKRRLKDHNNGQSIYSNKFKPRTDRPLKGLTIKGTYQIKYVYILQSINHPNKFYIGSTFNLKRRFQEHNSGKAIHTSEFKPWKLITYFAFSDFAKANKFELYLKSGSGRGFAKSICKTSRY